LDLYMFGLPMHVDWTKIWDFDEAQTGWRGDFWIGTRF